MRWITGIVAALLTVAMAVPAGATPGNTWRLHTTGSDARLRGLSAVSPLVAWASGSAGTILRTIDGGRTWERKAPAGTVGGLSTAELIRKAREDESIKAVVLRINSPGGSVFGSELVRRELELTRASEVARFWADELVPQP